MNESMPPAALLRAAATLVERAQAQLNGGSHVCAHCDAKRYDDMTHGRALERIRNTPGRLRGVADLLEHGWDGAAAAEPQEERDDR